MVCCIWKGVAPQKGWVVEEISNLGISDQSSLVGFCSFDLFCFFIWDSQSILFRLDTYYYQSTLTRVSLTINILFLTHEAQCSSLSVQWQTVTQVFNNIRNIASGNRSILSHCNTMTTFSWKWPSIFPLQTAILLIMKRDWSCAVIAVLHIHLYTRDLILVELWLALS